MEKHNQQDPQQNLDSPVNTSQANSEKSLTNDESASTDPNMLDKPSFKRNDTDAEESGRFDGNVGI